MSSVQWVSESGSCTSPKEASTAPHPNEGCGFGDSFFQVLCVSEKLY